VTALGGFHVKYAAVWAAGMRAKLGLGDEVDPLVEDLLELMRDNHVDHTSFFRSLSAVARRSAVADPALGDWVERWRALDPDPDAMDRVNPVYIPRNHLVEEALDAATEGDLAPVERLVEAVCAPFDERPGFERYAAPAPPDFGAYRTFCGT
jgi:uncharacterized protein YdiU (UPF0061 family)